MPNDGVNATEQARTTPEATELGELEIRRLTYADLPATLSIEKQSFPTPWSLAMFMSELSRPQSICLAAAAGPELVGYLICARYDRVWHLANVAVAPHWRRKGLGTALVEAMFEAAGEDGSFTLEVRPTNRSAIAMYRRLGFHSTGLRRRYYPDNNEDALIMWRNELPGMAGA